LEETSCGRVIYIVDINFIYEYHEEDNINTMSKESYHMDISGILTPFEVHQIDEII